MTKKIKIILLTLLFGFFSLSANAALQWKVGAFIGTVSTGIAIGFGLIGAAPIVVAGTLAVGVHAAVIGLYWDDINPPSGYSAGISVVLDVNTPFVTPPGWTSGTIPSKEPIPPDSSPPVSGGDYTLGSQTVATFSELLILHANNGYPLSEPYPCPGIQKYYGINDCLLLRTGINAGNTVVSATADRNPYVCAAGYQLLQDNTCALDDETLVKKPSDLVCELSIVQGKFKPALNDIDCSNSAVLGVGTTTLAAASATHSVYMASSPTGSVTVYEKTYNSANNTTSLSTANFNGSSDLDFIQTANSLGNSVSINPVAGTGTGTGTGTSDAKDSSLNVVAGGDDSVGTGTTSGVSAPLDTLKLSLNPLKNWRPASSFGECPTGVFNIFNKTITLDSHCTIFNNNSTVIRQAMGVVFSISALFIVLAA